MLSLFAQVAFAQDKIVKKDGDVMVRCKECKEWTELACSASAKSRFIEKLHGMRPYLELDISSYLPSKIRVTKCRVFGYPAKTTRSLFVSMEPSSTTLQSSMINSQAITTVKEASTHLLKSVTSPVAIITWQLDQGSWIPWIAGTLDGTDDRDRSRDRL